MPSEPTQSDLARADALIRACWDNFIAPESTIVLRDLIVIEIAKAREAERERCAKMADDYYAAVFIVEHGKAARSDLGASIRAGT